MRAQEIVRFARELREVYQTMDAYKLAEIYGIRIVERKAYREFKGHTLKLNGYPTIIAVSDRYSTFSKNVLAAHELGHAFLHNGFINHFSVTRKNVNTRVEYEANLFAVALLCDDDKFAIPICEMSNMMLKSILDCNIYE